MARSAPVSNRVAWYKASASPSTVGSTHQPQLFSRRIDHGVAVVIVSSELDEIYALADRIAVMYEGKITGFRDPSVPATELGRLMAGGEDGGHAPEAAASQEES